MGIVSLDERRRGRLLTRIVLFGAVIALLCPKPAFNQQVSGAITGYVTDQSDAAVAGATPQITVTESPGSYCVDIYDVGNLTGASIFSITIVHP